MRRFKIFLKKFLCTYIYSFRFDSEEKLKFFGKGAGLVGWEYMYKINRREVAFRWGEGSPLPKKMENGGKKAPPLFMEEKNRTSLCYKKGKGRREEEESIFFSAPFINKNDEKASQININ